MTYIKDISRASSFPPLRWNHAVESFRVYLDRLVAEGMSFNRYVDHRKMQQFDNIILEKVGFPLTSHCSSPA